MPQYIYRIRPTRSEMLIGGPTQSEAETIAEHFRYLQELTADGQVLLAGRTSTADANTLGIVIFVADSDAAAQELMQRDPAVQRGVVRAELWPFRIALWCKQGPPAAPNSEQ
jgi:uncharacterized protein YciI